MIYLEDKLVFRIGFLVGFGDRSIPGVVLDSSCQLLSAPLISLLFPSGPPYLSNCSQFSAPLYVDDLTSTYCSPLPPAK